MASEILEFIFTPDSFLPDDGYSGAAISGTGWGKRFHDDKFKALYDWGFEGFSGKTESLVEDTDPHIVDHPR